MFINMVAGDFEHRGVEHYFDKAFGLEKNISLNPIKGKL